MPLKHKSVTPDVETQIGLIFNILQDWQIAEAARREREIDNDKTIAELKAAVKGNGKPGLEKDVLILQGRVILGIWILAGILGGVVADLVGHYSQYFK